MDDWLEITAVDEWPDPASMGFSSAFAQANQADFFVVLKDQKFYAYANRCPHTGAPLEWLKHQFLDRDKHFIQCAMHGALFRVDDGKCLRGPCAGECLTRLPIKTEGDRVWVNVAVLQPEP